MVSAFTLLICSIGLFLYGILAAKILLLAALIGIVLLSFTLAETAVDFLIVPPSLIIIFLLFGAGIIKGFAVKLIHKL